MMLDVLLKLKKGMITALNWALIVAVFMLVASVVWGVLTRSLGSLVVKMAGDSGWEPWSWLPTGQATWTEELARFLLIWVSLLGGAVAFGTKGHLGVDYFVGKFDPDARKLMMVVSHLIVLFFAAAVFLYGGWRVVGGAMEQKTSALTFLKMGHVYMALPIAGVFMVLFTIENLIETLVTPASKLDEPEAAVEVD
ncbi:MAG: TRAP transporter small permease [Pontiellaceae bacterium]|nr:TRAP transporter small permease [Pontiellaceae bacterium]